MNSMMRFGPRTNRDSLVGITSVDRCSSTLSARARAVQLQSFQDVSHLSQSGCATGRCLSNRADPMSDTLRLVRMGGGSRVVGRIHLALRRWEAADRIGGATSPRFIPISSTQHKGVHAEPCPGRGSRRTIRRSIWNSRGRCPRAW